MILRSCRFAWSGDIFFFCNKIFFVWFVVVVVSLFCVIKVGDLGGFEVIRGSCGF